MGEPEADSIPAAPLARTEKRSFSRRAVIGGSLGVAAAAALAVYAGDVAARTLIARPGKLVQPMLATKAFSVAHAGGDVDWPEMSMEAYRNSVGAGVDALEISLARSSDGVWFGLHDRTLDRTSGTSGFVASEHTWKEIQRYRISASESSQRDQSPQPYLRFEDLIAAFGSTHAIFVDPKYAFVRYYPELVDVMTSSTKAATDTFIAKAYFSDARWAAIARDHGFVSWGYYYGAQTDANSDLLPGTEKHWDILGMDYSASIAAWKSVTSYRKKVIGHIIPDRRAATRALRLGASGLMISGIVETLD